jgi:hypothetical protein
MACRLLLEQNLEEYHPEMSGVSMIPMVVEVLEEEEEVEVARVMAKMNLLAKDFSGCSGSCIWHP